MLRLLRLGVVGLRLLRRRPRGVERPHQVGPAEVVRVLAHRVRGEDQLGVGGRAALLRPLHRVLLQPGVRLLRLRRRTGRGERDDRVRGVAVVGLVLGTGQGGREMAGPGDGAGEVRGGVVRELRRGGLAGGRAGGGLVAGLAGLDDEALAERAQHPGRRRVPVGGQLALLARLVGECATAVRRAGNGPLGQRIKRGLALGVQPGGVLAGRGERADDVGGVVGVARLAHGEAEAAVLVLHPLQPGHRLADLAVVLAQRMQRLDGGGGAVDVRLGAVLAQAGLGRVRTECGEGSVVALLRDQPVDGRGGGALAGQVLREQGERLAPHSVVGRVALAEQPRRDRRLRGGGRAGGHGGCGGGQHAYGGESRGAAADVHGRRLPLLRGTGSARGPPGGSAP